MFTRIVTAALLALCVSTHAAAQSRGEPEVPLEIKARSRRKIVATHGEDPTASGTTLDLSDRVTLPRSLGDVVREAPGARVLSTGGMGAFSSLSLRGAQGDETLVLLDEIPLSTPDGGAFDLSLFPAELFQQVNVFRSGAPVWLGSGAIGGVLQLVPNRAGGDGLNATFGVGSYGTYQAGAGSRFSQSNGLSSRSQLLFRTTEGHYPYLDDRGTRFISSDDRSFKLKNSDFLDASGFQDFSLPLGRGTLHVIAMGVTRAGGSPGPAAQPTPKVRRDSTRALAAAAYSIEGGQELQRKVQLVAAGSFGTDSFTDLHGQLGLSRYTATHNRSFRGFLRGAGSVDLTRWLTSTVVGSYSLDAYLPNDFFVRPAPDPSMRQTAAGSFELAAHGSLGPLRYELRPSVRIEWSRTETHGASMHEPATFDRRVLVPTGRVGGVLEVFRSVALSASFASGTRLPTMFELFGDGGLTLPAPGLRPVKSTTYDGGITAKGRLGIARGSAELRGFWQERTDAIALTRTNQYTVYFENLSSVRQWGVESRLEGELSRWFSASGSVTHLDTETALGTRLPFRPRWVAYGRPELRIPLARGPFTSASLASEVWHRGFAFYEDKNISWVPACTKVGFGAAVGLFHDSVRISARLDDALDARCTDLLGYPLQGRSLFFSLSYREVDDDA
ncbi:MAG TPA: TonB-dependent receptor [Polyangiales bacterium]